MFKILIVGLNFHPELTGIGKYTGELAAYLAGQGHQVHVITTPPYYPHWQIQHGYHAWQYKKETWHRIEIQRCPLWVPRRPTGITRLIHLATFAISSLPALIAQLHWKPSVLMCIAPTLMNAPFVLAFARLSKVKSWLHIQDFELDAALKLDLLPAAKWLVGLAARYERALLNGFEHLSTISGCMLAHLQKKGLPQNKTSLFPNWVDTKKIYPLPAHSSLRVDLEISSRTFVTLYHGNMGRKQGLEVLLESARLLQHKPEILFVLCGEGPAKKELVELAASVPNLRFLELQPEEKLNDLVNLADVHLLPQLADAADLVMPSKLGTMLASGKPVIAGAERGTQIWNTLEKIGVLVPPQDARALADAIVELANDPARRVQLGQLSREYATQFLEKEKILMQFKIDMEDFIQNPI